jgi:FSR family fosmidomycin resistance protein-like MFS transporter
MNIIFDKRFAPVGAGHFFVDSLNGCRSILLTFLSISLGLTNSVLGVISTIYIISAALIQPVFGYVSDRLGVRWVVIGGTLWMGGFFTLGLVIRGNFAVVLLILASLGSGAFHPAGAAQATLLGRQQMSGKETTAASLFFMLGQFGYFIGPIIGGALLDAWSQQGLLIFSVAAIFVGIYAFIQLRHIPDLIDSRPKPAGLAGSEHRSIALIPIVALVLVAISQSWSQQNMVTFLPKYLSDLGEPAKIYGILTALYMGGSAVGNLVGGNLADRFGKQWVILAGLGLSSIPCFFLIQSGLSPFLYLEVTLAGFLNGTAYCAIVVLAQNLIPGGIGLASGLALGFIFSAGAIGASISGVLADSYGFPPIFYLSAALALLGGLLGPLVVDGNKRAVLEEPQL